MFTNRLFNLFMVFIAVTLLVSACAPNEIKVSTSFQQWHTTDAFEAFQSAVYQLRYPN